MGGRGCGKSWVGAFDLIVRALRRRGLYLVAAPTYPMLKDASLRSFESIIRQLRLSWNLNRGDMRGVLEGGSEILFRSADNPERLRGPNLSGAWLDEASQMEQGGYDLVIPCLREGGCQGWLSATFTPHGRQHWTYEVFGTGRPNTALVRARTQDNPFNPPTFADIIRQQYTSAMAAQELEGEFIGVLGALFRREWFKVTDQPPEQMPRVVRHWDLAGTAEDEEHAEDPDWTAGALLGVDGTGPYYVLDVRRDRRDPGGVEQLVKGTAVQDGKGVPVSMEQEPGASGKTVIDHYTRSVLPGWQFSGQLATGDKATRAMPFAAQAERGNVVLVRGPWLKAYLDEIEVFPFGKHDDQVDASSGAFAYLASVAPYRRMKFG